MEGKYTPSQEVRDQLAGRHAVIVVGPTGVGKTTLINAALKRDPTFKLIISDMSRASRPGERDGIDANFRTRQEILARKARREYVNTTEGLNGADVYATPPESFPVQGVGIMPLFAEVVPEFRVLPFGSFKTVFILPTNWDVWQERLEQRQFTPEQRHSRLLEGVRSLEFAVRDPETILIVNDDLQLAEAIFVRVLQQGPIPGPLRASQPMAKKLANELLARLKKELKNTK